MATDKNINNKIWTDYLRENPATDKDKYSINLLQYPSNLGSNELKHHIQFQINVRGKSQFNKNNRTFEVKRDSQSANLTNDELAETAETSAQAAGAAIAYGLSKKIFKAITSSGSESGDTLATLASVGIAAGTIPVIKDAISAHKLLKPDTTFRITDAIHLYVDGPPTVSYGMNYANKELGTLAGILSKSVVNTLKTEGSSSEVAAAFGAAMAKLPGMFGATDVQSVLSVSSKTALNPFKEVLFESVDFRSFAFRYRFMPKSKKESEDVKKIINLFKFHQHPELSDGKLFFIYPSEFVITYFFEGSENTYFHKFAPCVLEKMEVSYGGEQFSTFVDGNPTEITMSLIFRETEILTKNMLAKDHY
jgi:hypothetical protein